MKTLILSIIVVFISLAVPIFAMPAHSFAADSKGQVLQGVGDTGGCDNRDCADRKVNHLITTIVNVLTFVIGVAAVIMIMIGGLKYITSNGDSGSVSNAKSTIIYALVGLVIVALTQFLIRLVFRIAN